MSDKLGTDGILTKQSASMTNPYPAKIFHMAAKMDNKGHVSALCYKTPRAINLHGESWVLRPEGVTCRKCIAALEAKKEEAK